MIERVRVTADRDWYDGAGIALGIRVGDFVFTSGQAPIDEYGRTVGTGDFAAQARRALANVATVLANGGSGLDRVVKATVFVTDIGQQDIFAAVRAEHFPAHSFAESFVQVAALAEPDWMIEIEAVGVVGPGA
ncbi:RidA family protein [Nocardia asteroides]|uniref:RidA family protein n=1 Tax=Nocardia asteroides TaxID=1824 RepID=UPI001E2BDD3B|nr:RidA family protein [Nocardia asteroides]UGT57395.1 RidA family protein [Nocardia asteroides]